MTGHIHSIESFGTLDGPGIRFIAFMQGCPMRCQFCHNPDTWDAGGKAQYELSPDELLTETLKYKNFIRKGGVTVSGGEPLLQAGIGDVMQRLRALGLRVEIETNGAVPLADFLSCGAVFTMDYKLPSSRMEQHMCTENFALLRECDCVKFVCGSKADVLRAKEIAAQYQPKCPMYLSAVFGRIAPAEIVEIMKSEQMGNFRLQLQLHKFIWDPNARGV